MGGPAARKASWMYCRMILRLADGLAVMDEHGHLLVHRVRLEEKLALVVEALLGVNVGEAFQVQRDARPDHERAEPQAKQCKPLATTGGFSCHDPSYKLRR